MSRATLGEVVHALWVLLVVVVALAGAAVVIDFCAAENAASFERAGLPKYADLCAAGYADACPISESLTRWGMR